MIHLLQLSTWIIRILLILFIGGSCSENNKTETKSDYKLPSDSLATTFEKEESDSLIQHLEIPFFQEGDQIVSHTGYTLSYNETFEQANWVAYELTAQETQKAFERTNKFLVDPAVSTGSATDADYKKSGYDRGHLAPAADMGWSSTTMIESFYFSNMSPQLPGFNRGIWKNLESLVRSWANENESIYVVTGPVFTNGMSTIGANQVAIPNYYYKVILDYQEPSLKGIGFILPNASSSLPLQHFAVSIDSVEKVTGIDFYHLLEDEQETLLEKTVCTPCWSWKSTSKSYKSNTTSVQCSGITKKGARCRRTTSNANGRCQQHQ
jgi:endonuclease G